MANKPSFLREALHALGMLFVRAGKAIYGARVVRTAVEFWLKCANDWIFNMSSILAYNFLASIIPILIVFLAIAGLMLGTISPQEFAELRTRLISILPAGIGTTVVNAVARHLTQSAGLILVIGIVTSAFLGSRLFIAMENCFGIIYRLRGRSVLRQNVMAISMFVVYMISGPLLILGSLGPAAVIEALDPNRHSPVRALIIQVIGVAVSLIVAALLFGLVYVIVPNRRVRWHEVWRGTLVAAALLLLYEVLFPVYVSALLHPNNYGSIVGFLLVILIFFYYLAFILLLGAEINSWFDGQRRALGDIAAMVHDVQAHRSIEAVAGLRAGLPEDDLQHHKGASAMATPAAIEQHIRRDHRDDFQPPGWWRPSPSAGTQPPPVDSRIDTRTGDVLTSRPSPEPEEEPDAPSLRGKG